MTTLARRTFIQLSAVSLASLEAGASPTPKPLRLGAIAAGSNADSAVARVRELGFSNCQVFLGSPDLAIAGQLKAALQEYSVEGTSLIITGPGTEIYDFQKGPETIGLVPKQYRAARIARMKQGSDFAKAAGIPAIQGHCGFMPEYPGDPRFDEIVQALHEVASYCKANGQTFRCETGQETPVALLRVIRAVGLDNLGVNFDTGNLILYGKANPVDALDTLGPLVMGVHAKDGMYPTRPDKLGREVAIGQGKVDFPRLIERLKAIGYQGPITIEREISGPKQAEDIRSAKTYLEKLIG